MSIHCILTTWHRLTALINRLNNIGKLLQQFILLFDIISNFLNSISIKRVKRQLKLWIQQLLIHLISLEDSTKYLVLILLALRYFTFLKKYVKQVEEGQLFRFAFIAINFIIVGIGEIINLLRQPTLTNIVRTYLLKIIVYKLKHIIQLLLYFIGMLHFVCL